MKPRLPEEIEKSIPSHILNHIYSFVPHMKKETSSPSLERELKRIQSTTLKGKSQMYMRDMENFLLD
jgi:hypothetical protein